MSKLNEHLEIKPMQEARLYAELRASNPHLPDPDFVAHGVKLEVGEVSLVTLHVYINLPDSWLQPLAEPEAYPEEPTDA